MSSADSVQTSIYKETTFGVSPTASYNVLPTTGDTLAKLNAAGRSALITGSRNVKQSLLQSVSAGGVINTELYYDAAADAAATTDGTLDLLLRMAFFDEEYDTHVALVTAASVTITAATGNVNATNIGVSAEFDRYVFFSGLTGTNAHLNRRLLRIVDVVDDDNIVVAGAEAFAGDQTISCNVTMAQRLKNGSNLITATVEKHYDDLTAKYSVFTGMAVNQLSISGQIGTAPVQVAATMIGSNMTTPAVSPSNGADPGAYVPAPTYPILSGKQGLKALMVWTGNLAVNTDNRGCFEQFSISLNNNERLRECLGKTAVDSIGYGKAEVGISLRANFSDELDYIRTQASAFGTVSFAAEFQDAESATSQSYVIEVSACRVEQGNTPNPGENQDVPLEIALTGEEFTSDESTPQTYTISLHRTTVT